MPSVSRNSTNLKLSMGVASWRPSMAGRSARMRMRCLLRHADRAIGLFERVASCFIDHRTPESVAPELPTPVGQRVCGIALGYEYLNDHDHLRHDPVLALLSNRLAAKREDCAAMRANQPRLRFASLAYVLIDSLRRIALAGTALARATAGSIRVKLLKIGGRVTVPVRRLKIAMTSAQPWRRDFSIAHERLSIAAC